MVSDDDIRYAYRYMLGREPEDEGVLATYRYYDSVATLRSLLANTNEGSHSLRQIWAPPTLPDFDYQRTAVIFLHLPKTGGTALYDAVASHNPDISMTMAHVDSLAVMNVAELNSFDFISGHFTYGEAMAVPRQTRQVIAIFREPHARLLSFYRFHRAHPPRFRALNLFVELAQDHDPVAFFSHPMVRHSTQVDNVYVRTFAVPSWHNREPDAGGEADFALLFSQAASALHMVAVVGLTDDMDGTARLIRERTTLKMPEHIERRHETDMLADQIDGFTTVPPIAMTPELQAAMADLVGWDARLYRLAQILNADMIAPVTVEPATAGIGRRQGPMRFVRLPKLRNRT